MNDRPSVIRPTDAEAIRLAKTLVRSARYGAIAVIEAETGVPFASRVGVATDIDGAPLILVSLLSTHTRALRADPRCSLLVGEPGKGDPLAYPRLSLVCRAVQLEAGDPAHERAQRRYLNRNPKAKLYAGLGDFRLFRLEPGRASLNGGFGKAFLLNREELVCDSTVAAELAASEQRAIDHMNADHLDAIELYAGHFARASGEGWTMTGIDPDGIDLAAGDATARVFFPSPLNAASEVRQVLVDMVREARAATANA